MAGVDRFRRAEEDLLVIAEYIARDSPAAAAKWLDQIETRLAALAMQPYTGERVDHLRSGLRRVTYGSYLIYYEPRDDGIILVRVLHGARHIEELF
jgi:toxin ParE1/3/4